MQNPKKDHQPEVSLSSSHHHPQKTQILQHINTRDGILEASSIILAKDYIYIYNYKDSTVNEFFSERG